MVRIPYESRAIHRPKQSQQKASSCQKNGARVVSHSGERTVRIRKVEGSIPFGSTIERISEPYIVWGKIFVQTKRHPLP